MKNYFGIITGEPQSINTEILFKSWQKLRKNQKRFFLIGSFNLIQSQLKLLKKKLPLIKIKNIKEINQTNKIFILDVPLKFSKPYKIDFYEKKKYLIKSFEIANDLSTSKKIKGFINCPVDKKIFNDDTGVTEFLAKKNKVSGREVMMIYNKVFSVVPLTTHIKVKNISSKINKNYIYKKINTLSESYRKIFKYKPKISVLGLNPHNYENRVNSEENKIIKPVISILKKKGINIVGPKTVDEIFFNANYKKYDVIVGMYHDQILSPFKIIVGFNAINITLGLNYLRLSPDHGTGVDRIGKFTANPNSLINCINFFSKLNV